MLAPQPPRPGDVVRVIAPSGPFEPTLAWRGLAFLSERYRVRFSREAFRPFGYLAGDARRRAAELSDALSDPDARAVVAFRGGYGLNQIVHLPDWNAFARSPKWIVGFSDITALHVEAAAVGVQSLHATMVAQLGRGCAHTRALWLDAFEHAADRPLRWRGLQPWQHGRAAGPLVGGNLTVLHACAAANRLRLPKGCIVLLEDVGERPYRLDRALSSLIAGGHLASAAGIVLGDFLDCDPNPDGVTWQTALREVLSALPIPVAAGMPVGHGIRNDPVVLGRTVELQVTPQTAELSSIADDRSS